MNRRAFIGTLAGGLLTAPLAAGAQQAGKVYRIGYLGSQLFESFNAFRTGLRELGWVEGRNLAIEYRLTEGRNERYSAAAAELAGLKVDLIVTTNSPGTRAAKEATATIPIVMIGPGDPVGAGFVESLARPGGNITGIASLGSEFAPKFLQLLKEAIPGVSRVVVLSNPTNPGNAPAVKAAQAAGPALGIRVQVVEVTAPADFDQAFSAMLKERAEALLVGPEPLFIAQRRSLIDFAAAHRLPAVYGSRAFVDEGGLMSYGASDPGLYRRGATYVDKILRGAKPGDLPVEQPTKFDLIINLRTAKVLGLTIPPSLLQRADQVIE
jgi:putative ABC transport system substrate-binding protein